MRRTRTETVHVRGPPRSPARFARPRHRCNRVRCWKPTPPRSLRSRFQFAGGADGRFFGTACGSNVAGDDARRRSHRPVQRTRWTVGGRPSPIRDELLDRPSTRRRLSRGPHIRRKLRCRGRAPVRRFRPWWTALPTCLLFGDVGVLIFQSVNFRKRSFPLKPQLESVLEDRLEPGFLGLANDVENGAVRSHQFTNLVAGAEEAVNRGAPDGAYPIAARAAALLVNGMAGLARDFEFCKQLQLMRLDLPLGLAGGAKYPHESLGNHEPDERLQLVTIHPQPVEAVQGLNGVVRVQRGEDEVSGFSGRHRQLGRIFVTHFTDKHYVRVLPEALADRVWKRDALLRFDLDLGEAADPVFDGVFDSYYLRVLGIEMLQDGIESCGLAGTGGPGNDDEPARFTDAGQQLLMVCGRQVQLLQRAVDAFEIQQAHHHGFPVHRGRDLHTQVQGLTVRQTKAHAAGLEAAHTAGQQSGLQLEGLEHFLARAQGQLSLHQQIAMHPKTDAQVSFRGLQVDVAGLHQVGATHDLVEDLLRLDIVPSCVWEKDRRL